MANTVFDLSASGELLLHGSQADAVVEFNAGDVLNEFNKVDVYFVFDGKNTVSVPLVFTQSVSQEIDLKQIASAPKLFSKVGVYCGLYDDTTSDGDLYESVTTNTVVLTFAGKTLADYGIEDAYKKTETYSKAEVDAKIPTKVSQLQNDSGYLTQHQDISGKADKSEIPTKVSQLQNDSGYLTQHQDISGKADKSYVDEMIGGIETLLEQV